MATYVQFSGWNPNFVVYGYPGNDSSLTILHQATSSFPIPTNIRTDIGPIVSTGLTTFIRIDGGISTPVPTYLNLSLFSKTSLSSVRLATVDKDEDVIRIIQDNFHLPVAIFSLDSTTGDFFIYFGIQTSLISGTTLAMETDVDMTVNRYTVYASSQVQSISALKPGDPSLPYIDTQAC